MSDHSSLRQLTKYSKQMKLDTCTHVSIKSSLFFKIQVGCKTVIWHKRIRRIILVVIELLKRKTTLSSRIIY